MPRGLTELSRALPDAALTPNAVVSRRYHAEHWWLYPATVRIVVSEYVKFIPAAARLALARLTGPSEQPAEWVSRHRSTPISGATLTTSLTSASRP
jgi:hypothetical protein